MSGMHPQFMLSKRFPVHTAIEMQDLTTLASLLSKAMDARFHFERKLTNNEVSVLHQACCARTQPSKVWVDIVTVCIRLGAPVNEPDCIGQTPLFYAITHCQANELVPLLLKAGAYVNQPRWSDGWTVLHVAAMVGTNEVTSMLLQAGANTTLLDDQGRTPDKLAIKYGYKTLAETIKKSPKSLCKKEIPIIKPSQNDPPQVMMKVDTQTNGVHTNGVKNYKNDDLDGISEEVAWALQMKREQEEAKKKTESINTSLEDNNVIVANKQPTEKRKTQEERMREIKAKYEEERKQRENPQQSQAEQLVNIAEVMERKRQRRMDARRKMTDKDKIEKEQAALREAMYDEIIWALELKKDLAEQTGDTSEVEKYVKLIKEEEEKKDGTWEKRIKQAEKEKEEKKRQAELAVEREKQMAIQKEADLKRAKENAAKMLEQQKKMDEEMQRRKEQEAFDRLPKWKKDKILRAKRDAEEKILKEKQDAEEKILKEKCDAEEKILREKKKQEDKIIEAKKAEAEELLKRKILEEEKEIKRKEKERKAKDEEEEKKKERKLKEEKEKEEERYKQQEAERNELERIRVIESQNAQKKAEEDALKMQKEEEQAQEKRKIEEARKIQEELKKEQEREKRLAEEQKNKEKIQKAKEEVLRVQEENRLQEEKIKAQERESKQKEEERQLLNRVEERIRKREAEDALRREEAIKLQEEKKKEEEECRKIKEEIRKEQMVRDEEEFNKRQLEKRLYEEKRRAEEQAMMAEEKKRLEEAKRKADEEMKNQLERVEARRKRRAEEEAVRIEELKKMREERTLAEKVAREAEQERIKQHNEMIAEEEERARKREFEEYMKSEDEQMLKIKKEEELAMQKLEEENKRKEEELNKMRQEEEDLASKENEECVVINFIENQPELKIDDGEKEQSKPEGEEDWEDYDWEWEDDEQENIISIDQDSCNKEKNVEPPESLQSNTLAQEGSLSVGNGEKTADPLVVQENQLDEYRIFHNSELDITESRECVVNELNNDAEIKLKIETPEAIELYNDYDSSVMDDTNMNENMNKGVINESVLSNEMDINSPNIKTYENINGDSENEYSWEWKDTEKEYVDDDVLDQNQAAMDLINYMEDTQRRPISSQSNSSLYKDIETDETKNDIGINGDLMENPVESKKGFNKHEHEFQENRKEEETDSSLQKLNTIHTELEEDGLKETIPIPECDAETLGGDETKVRIHEEPETNSFVIQASNNIEKSKVENKESINNVNNQIEEHTKDNEEKGNQHIVKINHFQEEPINISEDSSIGMETDYISFSDEKVMDEGYKSIKENEKETISSKDTSDKANRTMVLSEKEKENQALEEKMRLQDLIRIVQEKIENAKKEREQKPKDKEYQEETSHKETCNSLAAQFNSEKEEMFSLRLENNSHASKDNKPCTVAFDRPTSVDISNDQCSMIANTNIVKDTPNISKSAECIDDQLINITNMNSDTKCGVDVNENENSVDFIIASQTKIKEFEQKLEQNNGSHVKKSVAGNNDSTLSDHSSLSGIDSANEYVDDCESVPPMSEAIETKDGKSEHSSRNSNSTLAKSSDFEEPSCNDKVYLSDQDLECQNQNAVFELPNIPPRKRENKQSNTYETFNRSLQNKLDYLPAKEVLAKDHTSAKSSLIIETVTGCASENQQSVSNSISEHSFHESTAKLEEPNFVFEKDDKQKYVNLRLSEPGNSHPDINPINNVCDNIDELKNGTEIDNKNAETEEKTRLERLISMVQEKINAARKKKEQEQGN